MNLFILDENPVQAAVYNCDKHVVKIILEAGQMLCVARTVKGLDAPYQKLSHVNHPVAKWVRATQDNYQWTLEHALGLCKEYTSRYNKIHKWEDLIRWCAFSTINLPSIGLQPFVQAMPDDCKCNNAVEAYRAYYLKYKMHFAKWKNGVPFWVNNNLGIKS